MLSYTLSEIKKRIVWRVQELQAAGRAKHLNYCVQLLSKVSGGELDPLLLFMIDEEWSYLSGTVNSQSTK